MKSRDRVMNTLTGQCVDRVCLNVFAGWNPGMRKKVENKYGSIDQFCDELHIDIVTGVLPRFPFGSAQSPSEIQDLDKYLKIDPIDSDAPDFLEKPCDEENLFLTASEALEYKSQNKAVFIHAWGIFELAQFLFEKDGKPGFEEALIAMISEKEKMQKMFYKLAEWSAACVKSAIRAGADVIQISDDWGQQNTMFFNPKLWWEMIFPAKKIIIDAAKKHHVPVILHSDGDVTQVLDGIKQLGISCLHPVQESAGMSYTKVREIFGKNIGIMGGLDIVSAVSVMSSQEIKQEVSRIFKLLKHSGPYIFCSSHMFQDNDSLEVIETAYQTAYELSHF